MLPNIRSEKQQLFSISSASNRRMERSGVGWIGLLITSANRRWPATFSGRVAGLTSTATGHNVSRLPLIENQYITKPVS